MFSQTFFKLFPPPKFLDIPYAGLDISDDAVRCIEYSRSSHGFRIRKYGTRLIAPGVIVGGEIRESKALSKALISLVEELDIHVVRASLPEEKMYIFKTEVPSLDEKEIKQNIEFKLEENVPLTPEEAVFSFDLIPTSSDNEKNIISVSVAPQTLVISYLEAIKSAGMSVVSFEVQAKSIARALIPPHSEETVMIVHIMNHKTGVYIVHKGVVCFTSTISWGENGDISEMKKQLGQVESYWTEHGQGTKIGRIILSGHGALADGLTSKVSASIANVWGNVFSHDSYIPPITYEDSLDYAVTAGLALPS